MSETKLTHSIKTHVRYCCLPYQARHRKASLSQPLDIVVPNPIHVPPENGQPSLEYKDTSLAIPGQMNGVVSERVAHFVVLKVSGLGLSLKWDMKVWKLALLVSEYSLHFYVWPKLLRGY